MVNFAEIEIFSKRRPLFDLASLRAGRLVAGCLLSVMAAISLSTQASAFSQIAPEDGVFRGREGIISVPLPPLQDRVPIPGGATQRDFDDAPVAPEPPAEDLPPAAPGGPAHFPDGSISDEERPQGRPYVDDSPASAEPPLRVRYEEAGLPDPVRDLRRRLIEIAKNGDVEALRPYLQTGEQATALSVIPLEGDPIEFLQDSSGDSDGVELMAILLEVLQSGYVQLDEGKDSEIFVWPYFVQVPLDKLDSRRLVELFELVTAGDYQRMLENGSYDFYRVGISPEGRFEFFLMAD
ncbi:hypothetical protein FPY71_11260 [Aureimonas fodinaquatilis]|uniref:Uncharacterized protein n=1 Tax=Aureimonas fodinaquatilis TaxID=2565783 RepID=A0A5B0DYU9_9HYPH|nr:hypothetical protein [Aureimonas fodinaquatilis]KAA0971025.1 hypothetical protein FPY71_11260 [Aureimonas fodinaquatilis]